MDFFYPLLDKSRIRFPPNLSYQLSKLNFSVSSAWTLAFTHKDSNYYLTFLISKIFVWNSKGILHSYQIEGTIRKNNAIVVNNIVDTKHSLYFVLNNDHLYYIPDILSEDNEFSEIYLSEKVSFITASKDHYRGLILTTDNFLYFIYSNGTYSSHQLPHHLSFIKDFGDSYIGGFQNIIYQFGPDLNKHSTIPLDEYSKINDIFGELNNVIIVGYSDVEKLLISIIDISESKGYKINPHYININYDTFNFLENNPDPLKASFIITSKSLMLVFNKYLKLLGKLPITKQDYLISSFLFETDESYELILHFAKSGLHICVPYTQHFQLSKENFSEYLFYNIYLFNRSKDDYKRKVALSFMYQCEHFCKGNPGEAISKAEIDICIHRKSFLTHPSIINIHYSLIQLINATDSADEIIPYLNTNEIYFFLIQECKVKDELYYFSSLEKLDKLLEQLSLTLDSSKIILDSVSNAVKNIGESSNCFGGYDKLIDIIDGLLSKSQNSPAATIELIESKLLLTNEFNIRDINKDQILLKNTDDYEKFALKYNIIDILFEILNNTFDYKRAYKYASSLTPEHIKKLYDRFDGQQDVQRKLAIIHGWESVDELVTYNKGKIENLAVNGSAMYNNDADSFSENALALLCNTLKDKGKEVDDAISMIYPKFMNFK